MSESSFGPKTAAEWFITAIVLGVLVVIIAAGIADTKYQAEKAKVKQENCLWAAENSFEAYKRFCQ